MNDHIDSGTLARIGSVIAGFGAAMLFFPIQRELHMERRDERIWIPIADWLLIGATLLCLIFVIVLITLSAGFKIPTMATGLSAVLVAGYIFAILGHYRIICDRNFVLGTEAARETTQSRAIRVVLCGAYSDGGIGSLHSRGRPII